MQIAVVLFSINRALDADLGSPFGSRRIAGLVTGDRVMLNVLGRLPLALLTLDLAEAGDATILQGRWGLHWSGYLVFGVLGLLTVVSVGGAVRQGGDFTLSVGLAGCSVVALLALWLDVSQLTRFLRETVKAEPLSIRSA